MLLVLHLGRQQGFTYDFTYGFTVCSKDSWQQGFTYGFTVCSKDSGTGPKNPGQFTLRHGASFSLALAFLPVSDETALAFPSTL